MKEPAAQAFAAWLQQNEPELFAALAQQAVTVRGLAGITDILSSIGSGLASAASSVGSAIGTAAKNVGSFLTSSLGMSTLSSLATTYLQSQAQKNALQVQLAQAQANRQPAPIETRYDAATNTYVPVLTTTAGTQTLTPDLTAQLLRQSGGFDWQRWLPWIFGVGGGLALFIWLLTRDRR